VPVSPRYLALIAALVVGAVVGVPGGTTARTPGEFRIGIVEHAEAVYGNPTRFFRVLGQLRTQLLRVTLQWGGGAGVARRRPRDAANPADPAYDWRVYDRIVLNAARNGIDVVFAIFGTPAWANGGRPPNYAPRDPFDLQTFAFAAAMRYSGEYVRHDGRVLPAVRHWLAWNEPNLRLGLIPQFRRVGRRWVIQSAIDYARICNAIYDGIHLADLLGAKVACGVTAPRGNNNPRGYKPSVSPIAFLRGMKRAGARTFDAYAHHAYYGGPRETPSTRPRGRSAVTLGNIDRLIREVSLLYGQKRIWITEYGYQTNPPDRIFGVSWAAQARYLRQAYAMARRHPRIDMMLWFLLRDEPRVDGWQSGLISARGQRKPAFYAFRQLPR
jgi:hypothetical protein